MNYWVQQRGEILGPFSLDELKQLAIERKVRPDDKVSTDQHQWVIAARVPGLILLKHSAGDATPEDQAKQFRAALADEDQAEGEYRLSPEAAPPPAEIAAASEPKAPELPVGARERFEIPQQALGMALGGLAGVALLVLSLPAALIVEAVTGGQFNTVVAILAIVSVVVGIGFSIAAAMGSLNTLEMEVTSPGVVHVSLTRQIAYVRWSRWESYVVAGDRLEKRIKMQLGMFTDATAGDIAMLLLLGACCGGIPGALIWMYAFRSGASGESMCGFQLVLIARENPAPVVLYSEKVTEYFAERFGGPTPAENMIKWLTAAVPELVVQKIEA